MLRTYVQSLQLENFRNFESLVLDFDPKMTVIVGDPGCGKTAILDAIMTAFQKPRFADSDSRLDSKTPSNNFVRLLLKSSIIGVTEVRELVRNRASEICKLSAMPPTQVKSMIVSYGAHDFYQDPKSMREGYKTRTEETLEYLSLNKSSKFTSRRDHSCASLLTIQRACDIVLSPLGWSQLEWDFVSNRAVASHLKQGRLPLALLSNSIRSMFEIVSDIAYRASQLNPNLSDPAQSPSIILFDGIDAHFHPAWQQTVFGLFQQAFPNMQFIITTNSSLVVSSVDSKCVRMISSDGMVTRPEIETGGYDSAFALATVFHVDRDPKTPIARDLAALRHAIEKGDGSTDSAGALRQKLVAHFGENHPGMLELRAFERLVQHVAVAFSFSRK